MDEMHSLATDDVLTPAETRIAAGYCEGLIGKEIAEKEHISYYTVVRHTQNIYQKTGIRRSTNALVAWFMSRNCNIDMHEFLRSITAMFLLVLISFQTAFYTGDQFVRSGRRASSEVRSQRTRSKEDNNTFIA
ncbi:MAG: hypothetical protein IAB99_05440 [Bacteroidetes bacterium]|uniref:HTH luxR-type domain-containing protein n=1 Tax=Candidatus Cryptobacteroides faecipullorum TaxID=2840764 RepID=A0A9D9NBC0_9BACT|nr:hypothetical protein [Candidatus Cryptobacteroides faecipullorum]